MPFPKSLSQRGGWECPVHSFPPPSKEVLSLRGNGTQINGNQPAKIIFPRGGDPPGDFLDF